MNRKQLQKLARKQHPNARVVINTRAPSPAERIRLKQRLLELQAEIEDTNAQLLQYPRNWPPLLLTAAQCVIDTNGEEATWMDAMKSVVAEINQRLDLEARLTEQRTQARKVQGKLARRRVRVMEADFTGPISIDFQIAEGDTYQECADQL